MTDLSITRRLVMGAAAGGALSGCAQERVEQMAAPASRQFPDGFVWGAASSAFQIEGALNADGREPSIWDVFPRARIHDGSDASVATDSYRRYGDDVALLAGASLRAYRFSISWPRVVRADGSVNTAGVGYYARLVDALLAAGVAPYVTLFHWDLPQSLQDRGGWFERDTAERFAEYAGVVADALGDRVKHFIVLNEAAVHAVLGHVTGVHAPGLTDASRLGAVIHHQNLAQGFAIQALRAGQGDIAVGTTMALMPSRAAAGLSAPLNHLAADGLDEIWNGGFLDPLLKGSYPDRVADAAGGWLRENDFSITRQRIDFLGVNYYAPAYVKFDAGAPSMVALEAPPPGAPLDAFGRHIDPTGLFEVLVRLRDHYGNPRVIVTENGCSDPFSEGPAILDDQFRIAYLRDHIAAVKSAMEVGCDVAGYFHWTLLDNWEWAEGYRSKFGLVAHDRSTGVRTTKASYAWFRALAETGLLV